MGGEDFILLAPSVRLPLLETMIDTLIVLYFYYSGAAVVNRPLSFTDILSTKTMHFTQNVNKIQQYVRNVCGKYKSTSFYS